MADIKEQLQAHISERYTEILDESEQGASNDLAELWAVIIPVIDGLSKPDGSSFDLSDIKKQLNYKYNETKVEAIFDKNRILDIDFEVALELIYTLVSIALNLDDSTDDEGNVKSEDGEVDEYLTAVYGVATTALLKLGLILTEESENEEE